MALVVADRVQETSLTSGTGTLTLAGAVAGYQTFSTAIGNGNTTFYTIYDPTIYDWEVGIGTVGAGTLARTTVLSNSAGTTSPISFASNTKNVFCTYPSEKALYYDANNVATIGETISYVDTGIIGSFASTVAGYNQVIIQNKSSATNASSNLNVSNDISTASSGFAELGINSSTFTGSGCFNIAGAAYLASAGTDLSIGTYNAYNIHFATNSNTTDAMTIFNSGGVSLGGYGDPGIGTLYANNVYLGYTVITAAAGTTILTNASSAWQQVVGTTTQSIQLPDATTLFEGFAFTIANNSTGTVTVKDAASVTLDTAVTGGTAIMVLLDNSTVAGTWQAYSYIPSSYDFSTSTANFGTATITNATWNGNTIGYAYGGTGLNTFSAANNAIYSTSASALTAGTLPVAAGGSGAVTFTANGILYGSGTSAFGVTAAGTTGQVLIGNTGSAPSWSNLSSVGVTSISFGSTGLTPNTATTGAVTVAGTLAATSGGTGLTTYTQGDLVYASATNTLGRLADVATGNALISGGVSADPSWGKIGLTTHVSGTLPTANGGTNLTSFTSGGAVYATSTSALTTGTLPVASGGTGQTTYIDGQLLIGNTTGNTLTKATLTAGTGISITNGSGSISIASSYGVPVTSVTGTSPVVSSGGTTPAISLASGYGDTQNPYATKTANFFLAAPNGTTGNPTFRAIVAADIPTLNQNTTGSAGSVANALTAGTGISYSSGTTYNGSAAITISIPQAITTTSSVQFGSFGVGTAASGTSGEIRATNNVTAYYTSDKKFKENIKDIPNALDKVNAIGGKLFDWTDAYIQERGGEDGYFVRKSDFGVVAQDVQAVFPEAVRIKQDNTLAVDYEKLSALAFAAIRELKAEIDALKGK